MLDNNGKAVPRRILTRTASKARTHVAAASLLVISCSAFEPEPVATFELASFGAMSLPVNHTRWVDHLGAVHGELILGGRLVLLANQRFERSITTRPSVDGVATGRPRTARIAGTYVTDGPRLVFRYDAGEPEPHSWAFEQWAHDTELVGEEYHYFDPNAHFVATVSYRKDGRPARN